MARYELVEQLEPSFEPYASVELEHCPRSGEFVVVELNGVKRLYAVAAVLHTPGSPVRLMARPVKMKGYGPG